MRNFLGLSVALVSFGIVGCSQQAISISKSFLGWNYSENPARYRLLQPIKENVPSLKVQDSKFSITPSLPQGLSLDPVTGIITGTPARVAAMQIYEVSNISVNGTNSTKLALEVIPPPSCGPALNHPSQSQPAALCSDSVASAVSELPGNIWSWTCSSAGFADSICQAPRIVDGVCSQLAGSRTAPSSGLCSAGAASAVVKSEGLQQWAWTCSGSNSGATASCSAQVIVDGACGETGSVNEIPSLNRCSTGLPGAVTATADPNGTSFSWRCGGINGGAGVSCAAVLREDGICGSSTGAGSLTAPTSGLCAAGDEGVLVSGAGPWSWSCPGRNGGSTATCSSSVIVNGSCGSANNSAFSSAPSSGLCATGDPTIPSVNSAQHTYNWSCNGRNSGTSASCSARQMIVASCGSAQGKNFRTAPAAELCGQGTAGSVSQNGLQWQWACNNVNATGSAACTANVMVDGSCGEATQMAFGHQLPPAETNQPCSVGTASDFVLSSLADQWNWQCSAINGGTPATCNARVILDVGCVQFTSAAALVGLPGANISLQGNSDVTGNAALLGSPAGQVSLSLGGSTRIATGSTVFKSEQFSSIVASSKNMPVTSVLTMDETNRQIANITAISGNLQSLPTPASRTFSSLSDSSGAVVLNSNPGAAVDVFKVNGNITLGGAGLVLNGTADSIFVVNVTGTLIVGSQAAISLQGGVQPSNVIFNFLSSGVDPLQLGGGGAISGTFLAPTRGASLQGGFSMNGSLFFGTDVTFGGNAGGNFTPVNFCPVVQ